MKPFIIAEIGAKYGPISKIVKLITSIKEMGADAVKFQTYKAKYLSDKKSTLPFKGKKIKQYSFFLKHQLTRFEYHLIWALNDVCSIGLSVQ